MTYRCSNRGSSRSSPVAMVLAFECVVVVLAFASPGTGSLSAIYAATRRCGDPGVPRETLPLSGSSLARTSVNRVEEEGAVLDAIH